MLRFLTWGLSSLLIWHLTLNFPLSLALAVSHIFWPDKYLFLLISKSLLIILYFSFTHYYLEMCLNSKCLWIFLNFLPFFISNLTLSCLVNVLCIVLIFFYLLNFIYLFFCFVCGLSWRMFCTWEECLCCCCCWVECAIDVG